MNGKWLSQSLTGTQRYASEITLAIAEAAEVDLILHLPNDAPLPDWTNLPRLEIRRAPLRGVLFEQVYLPWATRGEMLLNFAGPAPLLKKRQLVTMHDATPFRYPRTFRKSFVAFYFVMYFVLARSARKLATVSSFSARELADVLGIPADRFIIAGCAADSLARVDPKKPDMAVPIDPYIVVGTLAKHKNVSRPVDAITASGRRVVVVGTAGSVHVFAPASSSAQTATIAGRLTDAELVWLYRNSRALVIPSRYEGFGLPVLEAQSLCCPVVSSNAASLPEVGGDAAIYFPPDDVTHLLSALDSLERDDRLTADLRRRGTRNAQRYTWKQSADSILRCVLAELR
ncbi:glycosyltransferase family 4 protein [[Mycobacterium] manitobense]|uniref:glycosyltransferase family 4 protein n=1 Tax=[Mycobacterium] manitobense TaxID=190147 RepID=UPI0021F34815|nr:glycosyltransferase family 1 protein [[Mycobacterium] manitobense]